MKKNTTIAAPVEGPTDAELMAEVANNRSAKALETLYRRHRQVLRSVIMRVLDNDADGEEVLQDVFVQLWQQASSFSSEKGQLLGWLIIVARRRALDRVRRKLAYQAATTRFEKTVPADSAEHQPSAVDREIRQHELDKLIQELPPAQGLAVKLTFFDGLSQREIASHLSVPLGTIKTRIELGVKKLSRMMEFAEAA